MMKICHFMGNSLVWDSFLAATTRQAASKKLTELTGQNHRNPPHNEQIKQSRYDMLISHPKSCQVIILLVDRTRLAVYSLYAKLNSHSAG